MGDTDGIVAFPLGLVVGIIIAAGPLVAFGSDSIDFDVALPAWALCTLGLSLLGPVWTTPVWAAAGVGLAFPAFLVAQVMIGKDPGNLFPLAILGILIVSVPTAVVGMIAGMVVTRLVTNKTRIAAILVATSLLIGVGPVVFANLQMWGREADALHRVQAILAAQHAYQAQDPEGRYACSFGDLTRAEGTDSRTSIGEGGLINGYNFQLLCPDGTGTSFLVGALPRKLPRMDVRQALGRISYCIDEDGRILSLTRGRGDNCWRDGEPVRTDSRR